MTLTRSDLDQAIRHLAHARDLLGETSFISKGAVLSEIDLAVSRLAPADGHPGRAATELTVLKDLAAKIPVAEARTDILKALAVLFGRAPRK